jgi:hypothetical protein
VLFVSSSLSKAYFKRAVPTSEPTFLVKRLIEALEIPEISMGTTSFSGTLRDYTIKSAERV